MMPEQDQYGRFPPPTQLPLAPPPPTLYRFGFRHFTHTVQALLLVPLVLVLAASTVAGIYGVRWHDQAVRQGVRQGERIAAEKTTEHQDNGRALGDIGTIQDELAPLLGFNTTCSQYFANGKTGQPATYQLPCKPETSTSGTNG